MTILDHIRAQAKKQPTKPALLCGDGSGVNEVSYAGLIEALEHIKERLGSEGCQLGERCGLIASNGAAFVKAALGIMDAGCCVVPLSSKLSVQEREVVMQRAHLHAFLDVSDGFELQRFSNVPAIDGQKEKAFKACQPAYIRFTSGTTGKCKGVLLGHQTIMDRIEAANKGLKIGSKDKVLFLMSLADHFVVSLLLYLRCGATVLLPDKLDAQFLLSFANEYQATVMYGLPKHYECLAEDGSDVMLPTIRLAVSTSMGLSKWVADSFYQRMKLPITQALGAIEVGLLAINSKHAVKKPLSVGRVLPDYMIRLKDAEKKDGYDVGEICISGPGALDAYVDPWLSAGETLELGDFCTGDAGAFDKDGDLFIIGRMKNRIAVDGKHIFFRRD